MRKTIFLILIVCFVLYMAPVAYAQQVTYRDARIYGKIVTPDILYGSLFYRDNTGNYITHSTRTYIKVEPLYERQYKQLTENIDGTVVLLGKMLTSGIYANPVFIYHDVKPVDYRIDLADKYYFSFIQSSQQAYGIELENRKAMGDFIANIGMHSSWDIETGIDPITHKFFFDYRWASLSYQLMLGRDDFIRADIRKRMASNIFIRGTDGSNILVNKADVDINDIKSFMNKPYATKGPTLEEGPMTIFGKFKMINKGFSYEYKFTGVAGYTLEHWLNIFKAEHPRSEEWQIYYKPEMEEDVLMWATGYRWEERDEEGNRTGRWYFTPTYWIDANSFNKGLDNFTTLTSGELKL